MNDKSLNQQDDLPAELLQKMAGVLAVLAHPARLRIVEILQAEGEAPVHRITDRLALPQAAASHHLNKMKAAGLLAAERRQKEVWYRIAEPSTLTILDCIRKKRSKT